jgi:hypothetical protein
MPWAFPFLLLSLLLHGFEQMPALPANMGDSMRDKFNVDFDRVAETLLPKNAYRLADVEHLIEKVGYDLVRFRDNQDTDQLWKIQEGADGPVIVALYGNDGNLVTESDSQPKGDWEAVPDKTAMHIYYKGEPLVILSAQEMGIPNEELGIARRWLPAKLAGNEDLQTALLSKVATNVRKLITQRFPELTKVANLPDDDEELIQRIAYEGMDYDEMQGMSFPDAPTNMDLAKLEKLADALLEKLEPGEVEELADILYNRVANQRG